jgi:hypothetical protein
MKIKEKAKTIVGATLIVLIMLTCLVWWGMWRKEKAHDPVVQAALKAAVSVKVDESAPFLMDKPVYCEAGKPSVPFYIADRTMDLPLDTDIIVWPSGGAKTTIRLTADHPSPIDTKWRVISVQLPVDYVIVTRPQKPNTKT